LDSKEKIYVVLRNNNSTLSLNRFEVFDNVANEIVGIFTLKGGESKSIAISQDETGKGSVRIRTLDVAEGDVVEIDSIAPGAVITA
jgi:hypothetical protein